ncbi:MAG: carboxymuconolactone decarboxylase family protein [Gemmatimonadaceae bacterium]
MAHAPAMFETYLQGYERFRTDSGFSPVEQEVVFLTISVENACEYCVAAHSLLADVRVGVPREVTEAIRNGTSIPDARLAELAGFTRDLLLSRGRPAPEAIRRFLAAGYTRARYSSSCMRSRSRRSATTRIT